jgi:multiple sugar transport system permease protein
MTMAAATLAILPMLIVFTFAQRYIVEGITMTGLKM